MYEVTVTVVIEQNCDDSQAVTVLPWTTCETMADSAALIQRTIAAVVLDSSTIEVYAGVRRRRQAGSQ